MWQPDRLVIDLDPPPGGDFTAVRRAARRTGELLRELGFAPFAQVTGSKGIHVWTPLRRRAGSTRCASFARDIGRVLAAAPSRRADHRVAQGQARRAHPGGHRPQRLRPDRGAALRRARRARGAPVATPIAWEELSDSKLRPDRWNVTNVLRRLAAKGDPWADINSYARGISRARRRIDSLLPTP